MRNLNQLIEMVDLKCALVQGKEPPEFYAKLNRLSISMQILALNKNHDKHKYCRELLQILDESEAFLSIEHLEWLRKLVSAFKKLENNTLSEDQFNELKNSESANGLGDTKKGNCGTDLQDDFISSSDEEVSSASPAYTNCRLFRVEPGALRASAAIVGVGLVLGAMAIATGCCGAWPLCLALAIASAVTILIAAITIYCNRPSDTTLLFDPV